MLPNIYLALPWIMFALITDVESNNGNLVDYGATLDETTIYDM